MSGNYWTDTGVKTDRPPDWDRIRSQLRRRSAGKCEQQRLRPDAERCPAYGVDVVFIRHDGGTDLSNLAWLCSAHRQRHAGL